jgi:predicted Fe-Mo cluster-binding NifX family protein
MSLKVAVASKSGRAIDEHFGHARLFRIYALDAAGAAVVEERDVEHYCLGGHGDRSAREKILDTIGDCDAVFVAKVGDGPAEKLAARGVEPVSDYPWEEIEPALRAWFASRTETTGEAGAC